MSVIDRLYTRQFQPQTEEEEEDEEEDELTREIKRKQKEKEVRCTSSSDWHDITVYNTFLFM